MCLMYIFTFNFFFCMYFAVYVLSAYDGYTKCFITEVVDYRRPVSSS